ncbi:dCMP deaminase [Clostridium phage CPD4]|nr:dCMP deaminase [Clostridium phage CPD4]
MSKEVSNILEDEKLKEFLSEEQLEAILNIAKAGNNDKEENLEELEKLLEEKENILGGINHE